jgi:uncharacterized protein YdeI (YjbR/CyaY-like superfamily)
MSKKDPRIDAYIARSADFAKPLLNRIRKLVHAACPDVVETIKWSAPFYDHQGILLATPAFKRHCALVFWRGSLFLSKDQKTKLRRLTSISDLPGDQTLTGHVRKAVALNEAGVKTPGPKPKAKKALVVPDDFLAALKKNKKALSAFGNFSPSHKREYVEWITEAKREETRAKRIKSAVQLMARGKPRYWKYI